MTNVNDLKTGFHYAMHGMGEYKKQMYTNSREAFDYWYHKGISVFEVDIAETSDKRFVCIAHHLDYHSLKRLGISDIPKTPTYDWFKHQKLLPWIDGGLTPLSLDDIMDILIRYNEIILMLDLFGQFSSETIDHLCKELIEYFEKDNTLINRLLIEAYNQSMIQCLYHAIPGVHIIYGIDAADPVCEYQISAKQLIEMNIEFVSFPWHYQKKYPGKLKELVNNNLTIFSRTIDNLREQKLKNSGIQVILIDTWYDLSPTTLNKNKLCYQYIYIYIYKNCVLLQTYTFVW